MLFARWCTYLEGMLAVLPVRCMAQMCLQDENLFQALYLVWLMLATCQPFAPFPHVTCDHAVAHATSLLDVSAEESSEPCRSTCDMLPAWGSGAMRG